MPDQGSDVMAECGQWHGTKSLWIPKWLDSVQMQSESTASSILEEY